MIQGLRGVQCTAAVTTVVELGDLSRFENPRPLMSYLGLTPSEYSSGERRRQGGSTKTGNSHARRALIEGAWADHYPAQVSRHLQRRLESSPSQSRLAVGGRRCGCANAIDASSPAGNMPIKWWWPSRGHWLPLCG